MTTTPLPPVDFLRECFSYDPETGEFRWRRRPTHHFENEAVAAAWNTRHAGERAFTSRVNHGYLSCEVVFMGRRARLNAARVALKMATGAEPETVDHRDRVVTNNRLANLRPADRFDNARNKAGPERVLPKGVNFEDGRFAASVRVGGRKRHLGRFDSPRDARAAYLAAAAAAHGEFFNPGEERPTIWD